MAEIDYRDWFLDQSKKAAAELAKRPQWQQDAIRAEVTACAESIKDRPCRRWDSQ